MHDESVNGGLGIEHLCPALGGFHPSLIPDLASPLRIEGRLRQDDLAFLTLALVAMQAALIRQEGLLRQHEEDQVLREALGIRFSEYYATSRVWELKAWRETVTDWERERYERAV